MYLSLRAKRRVSITQVDASEILPPSGRLNDKIKNDNKNIYKYELRF